MNNSIVRSKSPAYKAWSQMLKSSKDSNLSISLEISNFDNFERFYIDKTGGKKGFIVKLVDNKTAYSIDNIEFINPKEIADNSKRKPFTLTSPEGDVFEFIGVSDFIEYMKHERAEKCYSSCVYNLINGKVSNHKGWSIFNGTNP